MKVPFSPPRMDQRIIDAVADVLRSGWITTGPRVRRFEELLTAFTGSQDTVCLNSGSAGLELALRWFGLGPGDEVILPAYTYAASANVVIHCGARPVFVDSLGDFNLDPAKVLEAITPRTKAVMAVDIGGWPCDYDAIRAILERPDTRNSFHPRSTVQEMLGRPLLLSDAAHSLGAIYKGRDAGVLADMTVFSFHAVKNLTTAEGGAICLALPESFNTESVARELRTSALHGQSKDALAKMNSPAWRYDILDAGYKCNMTDIQAAMGIVELERYREDMLPRRRAIMTAYDEAFSDDPRFTCPTWENNEGRSSFHLYMLRVNGLNEQQRDRLIQEIFERDVAVNVHFVPLPMMTYYRNLGYDISDYPQAYCNYAAEVSLPVYYDLNPGMQREVITAVKAAMEKVESAL